MTHQVPPASAESPEERTRNGLIAALIAYLSWGFLPIYFKVVQQVPAMEVLAHRIVWSVPFGLLIILGRNQWGEVRRALGHAQTFGFLTLAAIFIAVNWLVYIWAVQHNQIFQASLGYYINPLMYVVIGIAFLGERLRAAQLAAVLLAGIGVGILTVSGGEFPVIALTLAISFTVYGVIRKQTAVGGMPGLFVETLVLLPLAGGYLAWLMYSGKAVFGSNDPLMAGTLMLSGPLTVLPLLCFALGARRLNLSTIGIMQFIAPTLQFMVGLSYGERLTLPHAVCFGCIWTAVVLFSLDAWRVNRAKG